MNARWWIFVLLSCLLAGPALAQDFPPEESCLAYRASKTMFLFNDVVVWGVSCEVEARMEKAPGGWVAQVTVPFASFDSKEPDRDEDLQENYFHVDQYPNLKFVSAVLSAEDLAALRAGESVKVQGMLTVKEQTNEAQFALTLNNGWVTGKAEDQMTRLGIEQPKVAGGFVISVHDPIEIHVRLKLDQIAGAEEAMAAGPPAGQL